MTWFGVANSGDVLFSTADASLYDFNQLDGDVKGGAQTLAVSGIAGIAIEDGVPDTNDILKYNGSIWQFVVDDGATAHDLLGTQHSDTTTHVPVNGDLIVGSGGNTWNALSIGAVGSVVYSDGTDVLYTQLGQNTPFASGGAALPSVVFEGDPNTGLYWVSPDIVGISAGGALQVIVDGTLDAITIDMGQVVKSTAGGGTTLTAAEYVYLVTAAPVTVTLPASPATGQVYYVKDRDGLASGATRITIDGNGNNIDGNSLIEIKNAYGSFTIMYNGTEWNIL
jgi:hypothetical protein